MRIAFAAAALAAALGMSGAFAQDSENGDQPPQQESLEAFLASCDAGDAACRKELISAFHVASDQMFIICPPPEGLTDDEIVDAELKWLHNAAASDENEAKGGEIDAEFDAVNALWPCPK